MSAGQRQTEEIRAGHEATRHRGFGRERLALESRRMTQKGGRRKTLLNAVALSSMGL